MSSLGWLSPPRVEPHVTELLQELNQARCHPRQYADTLRALLPLFDDISFKPPGQAVAILTDEGSAAVDDAVACLESLEPLEALQLEPGLNMAAEDHVRDHGPKGLTGQVGSDGTRVADRARRYGECSGCIESSNTYGASSAKMAIAQLVIDDGLQSRANRKRLLSPRWLGIGMAMAQHATLEHVCTVVYAAKFRSTVEESAWVKNQVAPEPAASAPIPEVSRLGELLGNERRKHMGASLIRCAIRRLISVEEMAKPVLHQWFKK
eukprot:TRINITY_DN16373_c0_g4_i1.p1 TRINITY_DN16373_c0_g4~~TRINITY_DN16373_c0_g4_i1.p1  ORF type:complete len:265 (+),score=42.24 TRINITY_DN16373_c0_g4_i1:91-885(+)